MHFCLQSDKLKYISHWVCEHSNWLPVAYEFKQYSNSIVFKYFNYQCPSYIHQISNVSAELLKFIWVQLKHSFQKKKKKKKRNVYFVRLQQCTLF